MRRGNLLGAKEKISALVVEDSWLESSLIRDYLGTELRARGYSPVIDDAISFEVAYQRLSSKQYHFVIFDIDLDRRGAGLELLERFAKEIQFSVISSARQSNEIVQRGYVLGCNHFLQKPVKQEKIGKLVHDFQKKRAERDQRASLLSRFVTCDRTTSLEIEKVLTCGDLATHISGPTGVGKQVVAELIHEINSGPDLPFIERNCSAVSESLADSFLFGHVKGAFTGAIQDQPGIFESAKGGTIFLDEIDKTSKEFQSKLLKVIEQKKVTPVGSVRSKSVAFKLVTAGSRDLSDLAAEGEFLPDLLERLQGEAINISALKNRPCDIELQLNHFIRTHDSGRLFVFAAPALAFLKSYSWPGNSRELKNLVDRFQKKSAQIVNLDDLNFLRQKAIRHSGSLLSSQILKAAQRDGLNHTLEEIKRQIVHQTYLQHQSKKRATMRTLDISSTLLYKYIDEKADIHDSK